MSQMVFCRACGHTIHVTAPVCPKCGAPQAVAPAIPARGLKNKVAAGVLAIFLGGLGVHRFYLGQWWGVFYLLFVWTGIPGIVAFIEGIVFLCTNQEKWDARHNQNAPSGGSGAGAVIVAAVAVVVGVALVGILAAIAIPAYQDYVNRAKTQTAYLQLQAAAPLVATFIQEKQRIPATPAEAGFQDSPTQGLSPVAIDPNTAVLSATLRQPMPGETESGLRLIPSRSVDGAIEWQCEAFGLREKQVPQACR